MTEWTKRGSRLSPHVVYRILVIAWIVLTLGLAVWWLVHGLTQTKFLIGLEPQLAQKFAGQQRMILWEGSTFIALLLVGGGCLFALLLRESRRSDHMKAFFATFTHELKTPLASLRLQAEALQEDVASHPASAVSNTLVERLLNDASRLELQLDNALFLATARISDQIHLENISIASVVDRLRPSFPDFEIRLSGDARVFADRRALESIVKNFIQNARVHGKAKRMEISTKLPLSGGKVELRFVDDGEGFKGDLASVGKLFYRHTSQSGSGIGLHLSRILLERMRGELRVEPIDAKARGGFAIAISIPEVRSV